MNPSKGYFITGTDTEVGKTLVAGAMILKLRAQGLHCLAYKPVVAGVNPKTGLNDDLETLLAAMGERHGLIPQDICPYILNEAIAPHIAANYQGVSLSLEVMLEKFRPLQEQSDAMIVEGAGGFLVPINEKYTLGDFAQRINLEVILVVGMKLGCINHALLTVKAIEEKGLKLAGWIGNSLQEPMPYLKENIVTLQSMLPAKFMGLIPSIPTDGLKNPLNQILIAKEYLILK